MSTDSVELSFLVRHGEADDEYVDAVDAVAPNQLSN